MNHFMELIILSEDFLRLFLVVPYERQEQALFNGTVSWKDQAVSLMDEYPVLKGKTEVLVH